MLEFLQEVIFSTPVALGDLQRESEEEAAQRHERMLACGLLALAGLLALLLPSQPASQETPEAAQQGARSRAARLLGSLCLVCFWCTLCLADQSHFLTPACAQASSLPVLLQSWEPSSPSLRSWRCCSHPLRACAVQPTPASVWPAKGQHLLQRPAVHMTTALAQVVLLCLSSAL